MGQERGVGARHLLQRSPRPRAAAFWADCADSPLGGPRNKRERGPVWGELKQPAPATAACALGDRPPALPARMASPTPTPLPGPPPPAPSSVPPSIRSGSLEEPPSPEPLRTPQRGVTGCVSGLGASPAQLADLGLPIPQPSGRRQATRKWQRTEARWSDRDMARGLERGCEDDRGADSLGAVPSGPQPDSPVTTKALPPGRKTGCQALRQVARTHGPCQVGSRALTWSPHRAPALG